jgi:hypothetical protein
VKRMRMEFTRYRLAALAAMAVILLGLAWGAGLAGIAIVGQWPVAAARAAGWDRVDYRVLATKKTSTMQKEMQELAEAGYKFGGVMGGETSFGGSEVVVVMTKTLNGKPRYDYRLLATNKTSTMQRELQEAGDAGFEYCGQTVFESAFGGQEVVTILERDRNAKPGRFEYKLFATKKTSTMQKELDDAGSQGYAFVGLTVSETAMGGHEVVTITRRRPEGQ